MSASLPSDSRPGTAEARASKPEGAGGGSGVGVAGDLDLVHSNEVSTIILDLSISSWIAIQGGEKLSPAGSKDKPMTSVIPLSVSLMWGSLVRFINAYCFGWPSMEITVLGVYETKIETLFCGKAEIWEASVATEKIQQIEQSLEDLATLVTLESPPQNTRWQHAPLMAFALTKALMIMNKSFERNKSATGRVLIVDAASENAYVAQETLMASCLHAARMRNKIHRDNLPLDESSNFNPSLVIDICSIQSHFPPVLETLAAETGGTFLSFSRELLVDNRDAGMGFSTPVTLIPKAPQANALVYAFSDFLMFHFLPTVSMRKEVAYMKEAAPNDKLRSIACVCHHEPTKGFVRLCPSCAAVYCLRSRAPAVCKVCGLRYKRKGLKDQVLTDRIVS